MNPLASLKSWVARWPLWGTRAPSSWWPASWGIQYPGDPVDYCAEAGDLWRISTIAVGLGWYKKNFTEAPLRVLRQSGDEEPKVVRGHPLTRLLARPNPYYSFSDLMAGVCLSWFTDGNAYVLKHRNGFGRPAALYWEPHWNMRPVRDNEREFLSHYVRTIEGRETRVEIADVIHFKNGLDPRNDLYGMAELKACCPEAVADGRWARHTATLARMGTPTVILAPKDREVEWDVETAAQVKAQYMAKSAEGVIALGYGVDMHRPALTPKEMDVTELRRWATDPLLAAMGLNAMALGLTPGTSQNKYANYNEARQACYYDGMVPTQRDMCEDWRWSLLVDFERDVEPFTVGHDYSKVQSLQEDKNALYERLTAVWEKRGIDRAEYRGALGFQVRPEDKDLYFSDDTAARDAEQAELAAEREQARLETMRPRIEEERENGPRALPAGSKELTGNGVHASVAEAPYSSGYRVVGFRSDEEEEEKHLPGRHDQRRHGRRGRGGGMAGGAPREFDSEEGALAWGTEHWSALPRGNMREAPERWAVEGYVGGRYEDMNGLPRGTARAGIGEAEVNAALAGPKGTALPNDPEGFHTTNLDAMRHLDQVLARTPVPEAVRVHRIVVGNPEGFGMKEGAILRDPGYGSTSLLSAKQVLEIEGGRGRGPEFLMQIDVPKGAVAGHINALLGVKPSDLERYGLHGEHELLLPRGTRMRINRVDHEAGQVYAEVLP